MCSTAGGKVTCSLGDMPPNTERTIVVTAQTATAGRLQNTVAVASANETKTPNNADGAYSYSYPATCGAYFWDSSRFPCAPGTVFKESAVDNESPDQTACCMAVSPPTPTPDVSLTKVAPATVAVGSTFDYTLTVAASGSTASNVVLTDPMPANVKALSASTGAHTGACCVHSTTSAAANSCMAGTAMHGGSTINGPMPPHMRMQAAPWPWAASLSPATGPACQQAAARW